MWSKDLLFIAFQQKENQSLTEPLQETIYSVTEHFRHRSLKIRHKNLSVTFSDSVMYWASQIKSDDVFC